jgi:hypothetical protein
LQAGCVSLSSMESWVYTRARYVPVLVSDRDHICGNFQILDLGTIDVS